MNTNKTTDYDPRLKFNVLPSEEIQSRKDKNKDQVHLQIQRNLFDPSLKIQFEEEGSTERNYDQSFLHSQADQFYATQQQINQYEVTQHGESSRIRTAPQPVPLDSEWLKKLPEICPSSRPTCVKQMPQPCQSRTHDTCYDSVSRGSLEPLASYDEAEDSTSFIKSLFEDSDKVEDRYYIRSLIPNVDDSSVAAEKDSFIRSLPEDLPDWQRSTYASMNDGDSSYALHYLDQTSPTSEHSIPITIEDASETQLKPKAKRHIATCERDIHCNQNLYAKHPPLIQKQYYSRFPGPQNPRRCTLRCPYKPCLEMRKEMLRCLLMNEYLECEKGLCNMGLGFISTQP